MIFAQLLAVLVIIATTILFLLIAWGVYLGIEWLCKRQPRAWTPSANQPTSSAPSWLSASKTSTRPRPRKLSSQ
jgi:peptidoglycan/LPS O-acetylase OafA/YrhL